MPTENCVRVKVCGLTSVQAAKHAARSGADALGLVFFEKSPRYLADLALARDIALAAGPFVTVVGLFVNPRPEYLDNVLEHVPLNLLQFHGDESDELCQSWQRPYIKALRMKPDLDIELAIKSYPGATGILLDAYKKGVPGGTGECFEWSRVPLNSAKPIVLAGGLSPENVQAAVQQARPWAVDVSGGVESAPGVKCPRLVESFIRKAKE